MKFKTDKNEEAIPQIEESTVIKKDLEETYCKILQARLCLIKESLDIVESILNRMCNEEHDCS